MLFCLERFVGGVKREVVVVVEVWNNRRFVDCIVKVVCVDWG